MSKITILLCNLLFITYSVYSTNYYVSVNGNNSNVGTSPDSPFKTIQHATNQMTAGDVCFIMAGVYRETVKIRSNNVTFKNYNNQKVIVSGADLVTNWTASSQGTGIFEAPFSFNETQFTQLFLNQKLQQMARWPNNITKDMMNPEDPQSGYEVCQVFGNTPSGNIEKLAKFPALAAEGFPVNHFAGGIFRGITGKTWWNPMGTITASNGTDLTVNAITDGWIKNGGSVLNNRGRGFGFIFHLNALDQEGEWFYKDQKIYYMPPNGTHPNNLNISVKKRKLGFNFNRKSNITLNGINIHAASVDMRNSNDSKILNCSVQYLWPFLTRKGYASANPNTFGGIWIKGHRNEIKNSYIAHSWGNGIYIENNSNDNVIENCVLDDLGWIAQFTSSVQNFGKGTLIHKNTFGSTGRFHIRTNDQLFITYNDMYDCMKLGQDAGSIQCTNGGEANYGTPLNMFGSEMAYNRIHDSNTLSNGKKEFVVAFYLEGCFNYTVHHNLIYNLKTDIVLDGTFTYLGPRYSKITDCYYYNNTVWNLDKGIRMWNRGVLPSDPTIMADVENVRFWNNIIESEAYDRVDRASNILFSKLDNSHNLLDSSHNNQNSLFEDANNGDFRLKPTANRAIDQGREITDITDGYNGTAPDIGAIELGGTFPEVGATIDLSAFDLSVDDSGVLSVNDIEKTTQKKAPLIYPNPAQTETYVNLNNVNATIQVFDLNGALIKQLKATKNVQILNLKGMDSGIYMVRINQNRTSKFVKLIKS